jgi:hypothetical protein
MKQCPKCNENKTLDQFGNNVTKSDGKQTFCKECRNSYQKTWYSENSEIQGIRVRKNDRVRKIMLQTKLWEFYLDHPCVDCGETDPIVLECDHQRDKIMAISTMMQNKISWDKIQKEIEKCEVRCSNCHRRRTAKQFGWYKFLLN